VNDLVLSAAHVLVADLDSPELDDADTHHLARVLRLRVGEVVTATDGVGAWRTCRWTGAGMDPVGAIERVAAPRPETAVAFALVKGDRLDWIVQKLTELGIDRMVPLRTDHAVVRWDAAREQTQVARLGRIAREAALQSRRVWFPLIDPVTAALEFLSRPGVARADFGGADLDDLPGTTVIAVGPEGGWSQAERGVPGPVVGLGSTVLRAETAAIAAGVLLTDRRRRGR